MDGAAQAFFVAGTVPLIVFGALHTLGTLLDTRRPTFFTPVDDAVREQLQGTGIRLLPLVGGSDDRPSMWRVWLGIHVSHGLGISVFGLLCLLIAVHDAALVEQVDGLQPLTIAFSAALLVLSVRFWFWGPLLITGTSTTCFAAAALL